MVISRITTFTPGQIPPQLIMAALTSSGLKNKYFLGPALNQRTVRSNVWDGPKEHTAIKEDSFFFSESIT